MKHTKKYLCSLFTLVFIFSCAPVPHPDVSENLPTLTADQAAEKGKASIVRIAGGNFVRVGAGSGFFIQPDKIVTNLHVIARPGPIFAKLSDGETIWNIGTETTTRKKKPTILLSM